MATKDLTKDYDKEYQRLKNKYAGVRIAGKPNGYSDADLMYMAKGLVNQANKSTGEKIKDVTTNLALALVPELAVGKTLPFIGKALKSKNPLLKRASLEYAPKAKQVTKQLKEVVTHKPIIAEKPIDWGSWNKEIPSNEKLLKEYLDIEKISKANNTWMKNPDGSSFTGTPEQFIQENSSNFKKAFPNGHNEVYRGSAAHYPEFKSNKAVFTGNESLAKNYATNQDRVYKGAEPAPYSGVHKLAHPKSNNSLTMDADRNDWTSVALDIKDTYDGSKNHLNRNIEFLKSQIESKKKFLSTGVKKNNSWYFPDTDIRYSDDLYKKGTSDLEATLNQNEKQLQHINEGKPRFDNGKALEEMRNRLGNITTTDKIAEYVQNSGLDYVKLNNMYDGGFGDVSIVSNKPGNYLKSLFGNNGMFDMTNPNIYKGVVPTTGIGVLKSKQQMSEYNMGGKVKNNRVKKRYGTGGSTPFDSSSGFMLEKGVNPTDNLAATFKRYGGTDDINNSFKTPSGGSWWDSASSYGSALGGISSALGNMFKNDYSENTQQAFSTSSNLSDMYKKYNETDSALNSLGSAGASAAGYGWIDQLGSGLGDIFSPNQIGEKSTFGAFAEGALNPEQGFNDLYNSITGKSKFQGKDLLAFVAPGLNSVWDNNELKEATTAEYNKQARDRQSQSNAAWQGYAKYGMVVPFANGGLTPNGTEIEVEDGEVMRSAQDDSMVEFDGLTHAQGGIDINAEPGSQIFGKLKVKSGQYKGVQYKDAASAIRKKLAALEKKLNS